MYSIDKVTRIYAVLGYRKMVVIHLFVLNFYICMEYTLYKAIFIIRSRSLFSLNGVTLFIRASPGKTR